VVTVGERLTGLRVAFHASQEFMARLGTVEFADTTGIMIDVDPFRGDEHTRREPGGPTFYPWPAVEMIRPVATCREA